MTHFLRPPGRKPIKTAFLLVAIGALIALIWSGWRARRLLAEARLIKSQSAKFPRDYHLGNGPKITYLAMGDSTAAGWGAANGDSTYSRQIAANLAARGFRVRVVNVAVGGATLAEVRRDQSAALERFKPDLVTLSAGANDATRRTSGQDFGREWRLLRGDLHRSGAQRVLVANVPDMFRAPALPYPFALVAGKRARVLNAELEASSVAPQIEIVDLFGAGKLDFGRDAGLYGADLFHPSGRGYAIWAALFIEKLGRWNPDTATSKTKRR